MDNPYFYVFCGFHHFSYNEDNSKNDKEMERMTMSNLQTPFRYDFVGSFLRPDYLKKARLDFENGKITKEQLQKSIQSWTGHAGHADSYNLRKKIETLAEAALEKAA
jgi:hypothetical protein